MPFHNPKHHSLLESQHLIGLSHKRLYLVYEDKEPHWWSYFFKSGYKHVSAVIFDGLFWIKMDFTLGYTDIDVLCYDWHDTIKDVTRDQDMITQYVEAWRKPRYRVRSIFAPWTCVEAMKSLLGIRAWWVITPYQLYKYCEAHHGHERRRRNTSTKTGSTAAS